MSRIVDGFGRPLVDVVKGFSPTDELVVYNIRQWPGLDTYVADVGDSTKIVDPYMYQKIGRDEYGIIYERITDLEIEIEIED